MTAVMPRATDSLNLAPPSRSILLFGFDPDWQFSLPDGYRFFFGAGAFVFPSSVRRFSGGLFISPRPSAIALAHSR